MVVQQYNKCGVHATE